MAFVTDQESKLNTIQPLIDDTGAVVDTGDVIHCFEQMIYRHTFPSNNDSISDESSQSSMSD